MKLVYKLKNLRRNDNIINTLVKPNTVTITCESQKLNLELIKLFQKRCCKSTPVAAFRRIFEIEAGFLLEP